MPLPSVMVEHDPDYELSAQVRHPQPLSIISSDILPLLIYVGNMRITQLPRTILCKCEKSCIFYLQKVKMTPLLPK